QQFNTPVAETGGSITVFDVTATGVQTRELRLSARPRPPKRMALAQVDCKQSDQRQIDEWTGTKDAAIAGFTADLADRRPGEPAVNARTLWDAVLAADRVFAEPTHRDATKLLLVVSERGQDAKGCLDNEGNPTGHPGNTYESG